MKEEKVKKNYETQWTNPITNETSTIEVATAITREQQQDLQIQWGIDAQKMLDNAAQKELEQMSERKTLDTIKEYAVENNQCIESTVSKKNATADDIYVPIKDFVIKCKRPVIYTNIMIVNLLHETLTETVDFQHGGCSYCVGNYKFNDKATLEIYCNPLMSASETEALVYDQDDPKQSLFVKYTLES